MDYKILGLIAIALLVLWCIILVIAAKKEVSMAMKGLERK